MSIIRKLENVSAVFVISFWMKINGSGSAAHQVRNSPYSKLPSEYTPVHIQAHFRNFKYPGVHFLRNFPKRLRSIIDNSESISNKDRILKRGFSSISSSFIFSLGYPSIIPMEGGSEAQYQKNVYSVWGLPQEDLKPRLKKLMEALRSEFGGPEFEPHVTVVGAIRLTETEALDKFKKACHGLKGYTAKVEKVATGTFFYQCVYLLLHATPEVVGSSDHCCGHFGYMRSTSYMPHLSLLYGDLSDQEKKKAEQKAYILDENIGNLELEISRLALYKTDTEDKSLKFWEKVAECNLE